MDEDNVEITPVRFEARMNRADVAIAVLYPVKGLLMGAVNAVDNCQSLLGLHSGYLDAKRERKEFRKEAHDEMTRLMNG